VILQFALAWHDCFRVRDQAKKGVKRSTRYLGRVRRVVEFGMRPRFYFWDDTIYRHACIF
jgi:nicotinic acid phosphoribosyltransferase